MDTCPHCQSDSISSWQKFGATPSNPIYCEICGHPTSIKSSILDINNIFIQFGVFLAMIYSVILYKVYPLVIYLVVLAIDYFVIIKFAPLVPLTEFDVVKNRRIAYFIIALIFLTIAVTSIIHLMK